MGANDAAEMLEEAKAECVRLERELAAARRVLERELPAARRVLEAWTVPVRVPVHHEKMQHMLRREWPVLARALDQLAGLPVPPLPRRVRRG